MREHSEGNSYSLKQGKWQARTFK